MKAEHEDRLYHKLDDLDLCADADAVATLLRKEGIKANPSEFPSQGCPLACWFRAMPGVVDPSVCTWMADWTDEDGREFAVALPDAAIAFVAAYDAGHYSDLAKDASAPKAEEVGP